MLAQEADAFSQNDDDIGCIPDLKVTIKLNDETPVQKNYTAVPRPLFPEVKSYVEDLLNKNYIRMSTSPYSSPVVCVREKDQTLRLCIDYRELNKKSIPDRHPIPRIQETLDRLGGNSQWTNYHQLVLENLLDHLVDPPVMAYPDFTKPFIVCTDASEEGLGAILYQSQNGETRVIAYASQSLTPAERNYHHHSGKLEFLALI
jgi:hypothetical protein